MSWSNTPTSAIERYLRTAEAELAEWESLVPELTKRLATAKRRVKQEAQDVAAYRAELARRGAEHD